MKNKFSRFLSKHYAFLIFLIFYVSIISYKLISGPAPFYDWDESLYVQTGKEMVEKPYLLAPVWQGQIWLDKTPIVPLMYGIVLKTFSFVSPEISTRIFTLLAAAVDLILMYILYRRVIDDDFLVTLATALTGFIPIFLQRAQVVNMDVFLLMGWLGYVVFFENALVAFIFLVIAVMSKSLIGFYPVALMVFFNLYLYYTKKVNLDKLKKIFITVFIQVAAISSWYIIMYLLYGNTFFKMHIIESHFRRVTSSIEFHFGKRTFYIDLMREQFGNYFWISLVGLAIIGFQFFKKRLNFAKSYYALYLLPWFIFLNLTKTKIFWYAYQAVPQFALLTVYPIILVKKNKMFYRLLIVVLFAVVIYQAFVQNKFFTTKYAKYESYYAMASYAKEKCDRLIVLMGPTSRKDFATLDSLGLLITTTKWWGDHPAIVYYFGKKVDFIYDKSEMNSLLPKMNNSDCPVIQKEDSDIKLETKNFQKLKDFNPYLLYRKTAGNTIN